MRAFILKVGFGKEAFLAEDYLGTAEYLESAFSYLLDKAVKTQLSVSALKDALDLAEQMVELPEVEVTDYVAHILSEMKAAIEGEDADTWNDVDRWITLERFRTFWYDLLVIIRYMDDYFGQLGQSEQPAITVAIDDRGQYSFYENVYSQYKEEEKESSEDNLHTIP